MTSSSLDLLDSLESKLLLESIESVLLELEELSTFFFFFSSDVQLLSSSFLFFLGGEGGLLSTSSSLELSLEEGSYTHFFSFLQKYGNN